MNFVLEKFIEYFKKKPLLTSFNMLLSLSFPLDDVLVPYLTGRIVTFVQQKNPIYKRYLVYLIIVYLFMQTFYTLSYWHDAKLFPDMQNYIRHSMLKDYLEHFEKDFQEVNTGSVLSRFVKIPMTTTQLFENFKNDAFPYTFSFLATAYIISRYDKLLALCLIVTAACVLTLVVFSPKVCLKSTTEQDQSLAKIDEETEDILRNRAVIYTTDQIPTEMERMTTYETRYAHAFGLTMDCIIKARFVTIILLAIVLVVLYQRTVRGIYSKNLDAGAFVTIISIVSQWFVILSWLSSNIREVVTKWGIIRAYEELKISENNQAKVGKVSHNIFPTYIASQNGIEVKSLTYRVPNRQVPILNDLTLTIATGDKVAVVGDIGSGKSTLLQIICGLIKPTTGEVYIDGRAISTMSKRELKKKIVYVPQNPILFNRSAYENMTYGLKGVDKETVMILLEKLGLDHVFDNLHDGIDSNVGKNGSKLSGGQRQILQCIRAVLTNPDYIILDEITASIDTDTKQKLFNLFSVMFKNKTILMVTHDPELLAYANRSVRMATLTKGEYL